MLSLKEKLEHNKKIVKRFEYELEVGIFKKSTTSNSSYYFSPFVDCDIKGKCFIKVLEKLGYRFGGTEATFYTCGILLNSDKKEYFYYALNKPNRIRNEIPNYILDYIEHPVLDTIKERLGFKKHG